MKDDGLLTRGFADRLRSRGLDHQAASDQAWRSYVPRHQGWRLSIDEWFQGAAIREPLGEEPERGRACERHLDAERGEGFGDIPALSFGSVPILLPGILIPDF